MHPACVAAGHVEPGERVGTPAEPGSGALRALEEDISKDRLDLPVLSEIALRARALSADPDCSIVQLADLISTDTALAARLLKVVNSAWFRAQVPVDSVTGAITRLGLQPVRSLITQLALLQSVHAYGARTHHLVDEVIRWSKMTCLRASSPAAANGLHFEGRARRCAFMPRSALELGHE